MDGTNYIEENYMNRGIFYNQRKNLHKEGKCKPAHTGVDLNRNFDFNFGLGDAKYADKCEPTYNGRTAFSEPESRALRDFIAKHKKKIKFVYNFHSDGNLYLIPFNSKLPNELEKNYNNIYNIFREIVEEAKFIDAEQFGPSN